MSPLDTLLAIWKTTNCKKPENDLQAEKELNLVRTVQAEVRRALKTTDKSSLLSKYEEIIERQHKPKRKLFFDIEVSPNIVSTWRIGNKISIHHDSIIQERAVICICYKWSDEDEVHSLKWEDGDDKEMLKKFSKILYEADEIVTQNGDNFDVKWLRTRCIYHRIQMPKKFNSIDTLKMARAGFKFNSNKLDYMGKFLKLGEKIHTEPDLWTKIVMKKCKQSMIKMIDYCKQDVLLLERVYNELQDFTPMKNFKHYPPK